MKKVFVINIFKGEFLRDQFVCSSLDKVGKVLIDNDYINNVKGSFMGNLYGQKFGDLFGDNWKEGIEKLSLEDLNNIALESPYMLQVNEVDLEWSTL